MKLIYFDLLVLGKNKIPSTVTTIAAAIKTTITTIKVMMTIHKVLVEHGLKQ